MNFKCLVKGHRVRSIDGKKKNLIYQKGKRELLRFAGEYYFCTREGCDWDAYEGPKSSFGRFIIAEESGDKIYSIDGTQYYQRRMAGGLQVLWPICHPHNKMLGP